MRVVEIEGMAERAVEQGGDRGVQVLLSPNTVDSPLPSSASASSIFSSDAVDSASRRARIALPRKSSVSTLARSSTSGGMSANFRSAT
jgi:hypothetical protein